MLQKNSIFWNFRKHEKIDVIPTTLYIKVFKQSLFQTTTESYNLFKVSKFNFKT